MGINFVDLFVWSFLLAFAAKGFMKGFVREVSSLLGLVVGGWAGFRYSPLLSRSLGTFIQLPQHVSFAVSFLLILLVTGLLFYLLGHFVTAVLKMALLGGVNRAGGVVFAALQGALILCIALYFVERPAWPRVKARVDGSPSARALAQCGRDIVEGWERRGSAVQAKGKEPGPSSLRR
jgi:membrane protein required for colicin V production